MAISSLTDGRLSLICSSIANLLLLPLWLYLFLKVELVSCTKSTILLFSWLVVSIRLLIVPRAQLQPCQETDVFGIYSDSCHKFITSSAGIAANCISLSNCLSLLAFYSCPRADGKQFGDFSPPPPQVRLIVPTLKH